MKTSPFVWVPTMAAMTSSDVTLKEIITGKKRLKYFLNNYTYEDVGRNA